MWVQDNKYFNYERQFYHRKFNWLSAVHHCKLLVQFYRAIFVLLLVKPQGNKNLLILKSSSFGHTMIVNINLEKIHNTYNFHIKDRSWIKKNERETARKPHISKSLDFWHIIFSSPSDNWPKIPSLFLVARNFQTIHTLFDNL